MQQSIIPKCSPKGYPNWEFNAVQDYWNAIHHEPLLENETLRVVSMIMNQDGTYDKWGILTEKKQIRTVEDLCHHMNLTQSRNPNKDVGFSISTAVFNYTEGVIPAIKTFKKSTTISIDIDTNINKKRHAIGSYPDSEIQFALIETWNQISAKLLNTIGCSISPKYAGTTGGGLIIVLEFQEELDSTKAKNLYGLLKYALSDLKWTLNLQDIMGNFVKIDFDIDATFADIAHVQRVLGSCNQKYGIQARRVDFFDVSTEGLTRARRTEINMIDEFAITVDARKELLHETAESLKHFTILKELSQPKIEVKNNLMTARMVQANRSTIKASEMHNLEFEFLAKIKDQGITTLSIIQNFVQVESVQGNLVKIFCPFHKETNASFALYINEKIDIFKDFHSCDTDIYNLITFVSAIFEITKPEAITKLSEITGVELAKSERKEFRSMELEDLMKYLIDKVDQKNFVYYRLANKSKSCIIRHIDSGETYTFDGPRMIAYHVLVNQINEDKIERPLVDKFVEYFTDNILIDAFELFEPGQETLFQKNSIQFVNLWVPSKNYKLVQESIKDSPGTFNSEIAMKAIKLSCPWTYRYLLQIVQKGDMDWFLNWLGGVSKFKTTPTVPVIFGVQGAGKNLFISTVMNWFLNESYVNIMNGDRIMSNFNSVLETSSLIVLDEGDFSNGKEVDQLKLLTGNDSILVERKGVDAVSKKKHFNFILFSNGQVPVRHPAMDRRFTYFKNDFSLLQSCASWDISIDDFIDNVKAELVEFWGICTRTEYNQRKSMQNIKNPIFWEQILKMHPFGQLIIKLINREWDEIALQLNENVLDSASLQANMTLFKEIRDQFSKSGEISMTLINTYLNSMSYRTKTSIQQYIQSNNLIEFGIKIVINENNLVIRVDKNKVTGSIQTTNVLLSEYPEIDLMDINGYTKAQEVEDQAQFESVPISESVIKSSPVPQPPKPVPKVHSNQGPQKPIPKITKKELTKKVQKPPKSQNQIQVELDPGRFEEQFDDISKAQLPWLVQEEEFNPEVNVSIDTKEYNTL